MRMTHEQYATHKPKEFIPSPWTNILTLQNEFYETRKASELLRLGLTDIEILQQTGRARYFPSVWVVVSTSKTTREAMVCLSGAILLRRFVDFRFLQADSAYHISPSSVFFRKQEAREQTSGARFTSRRGSWFGCRLSALAVSKCRGMLRLPQAMP